MVQNYDIVRKKNKVFFYMQLCSQFSVAIGGFDSFMTLTTVYVRVLNNLANQLDRKLGVFNRKFEGNQSLFYRCFDKY